eukprot:140780-Pelagomonas_calceolata.AAC.3
MLDLQEWEACLDDLRGAMELLPDCASLYYTCAMILYAKGNMLQAQEVMIQKIVILCAYGNMQQAQELLIYGALTSLWFPVLHLCHDPLRIQHQNLLRRRN